MKNHNKEAELENEINKLKSVLSRMERALTNQQRELIAIKSELREVINRQNRTTKR